MANRSIETQPTLSPIEQIAERIFTSPATEQISGIMTIAFLGTGTLEHNNLFLAGALVPLLTGIISRWKRIRSQERLAQFGDLGI